MPHRRTTDPCSKTGDPTINFRTLWASSGQATKNKIQMAVTFSGFRWPRSTEIIHAPPGLAVRSTTTFTGANQNFGKERVKKR